MLDELRGLGYRVGTTPWDYYGYETDQDLEMLGNILHDQKDADGRSAVMTAVFVMANAHLPKMRTEGYRRFQPVSIIEGPPPPSSRAPWERPTAGDEDADGRDEATTPAPDADQPEEAGTPPAAACDPPATPGGERAAAKSEQPKRKPGKPPGAPGFGRGTGDRPRFSKTPIQTPL